MVPNKRLRAIRAASLPPSPHVEDCHLVSKEDADYAIRQSLHPTSKTGHELAIGQQSMKNDAKVGAEESHGVIHSTKSHRESIQSLVRNQGVRLMDYQDQTKKKTGGLVRNHGALAGKHSQLNSDMRVIGRAVGSLIRSTVTIARRSLRHLGGRKRDMAICKRNASRFKLGERESKKNSIEKSNGPPGKDDPDLRRICTSPMTDRRYSLGDM